MCAMLTVAGIGTLILPAETAAKLQDSKLYQQPKHGENKKCFARRNKRILRTSLAIASQRSSCGFQAKWISSDVDLAGWKFALVWGFCGLAANSVAEGMASVLTVDISRCRELETSKVGTIACQLFVSATTKHPLCVGCVRAVWRRTSLGTCDSSSRLFSPERIHDCSLSASNLDLHTGTSIRPRLKTTWRLETEDCRQARSRWRRSDR